MRRTAIPAAIALVILSAVALATGSAASATVAAESHAPRIPGPSPVLPGASAVRNWTSTNWSGYAVTGTGFTRATGRWSVPRVSTPKRARSRLFSSTWVGIDGFNNSSLIQAGTEQDWINGAPFYQAWWEILPAPETPIPSITVRPGDSMSVSIASGAPNWTIVITDITTGQSFTTHQAYVGPQTSVEWIQEAPTVGSRVARLAPDSTVVFDVGTANGKSPGLVSSQSGAMFRGRKQISTPSLPDTDVAADGFAVAYGNFAPAAPSS
jgi:Peptidase A4 family